MKVVDSKMWGYQIFINSNGNIRENRNGCNIQRQINCNKTGSFHCQSREGRNDSSRTIVPLLKEKEIAC